MVYRYRLWGICFGLALAVMGLIWRMVDLMIIDRPFLLGQGNARSLREVNVPAYRGMILDRNNKPLAISTPIDAVTINPQTFHPNAKQLQALANILHIQATTIERIQKKNNKRQFAYLKRGVYPYVGVAVNDLAVPSVFLEKDFRRYYPEGEVAAQLIGFTNIDDQGQSGLELEYNKWLAGVPGKKRVLVDRLGHIIANVDLLKPAVPGHNLTLSLDRRIQYLAYTALEQAVHANDAMSGSVVVLNVNTGGVLAMANIPSFNPNNRPKMVGGRLRNRSVTDIFEPGSTAKAFSVANALASGKYTPISIIDTRPGWIDVAGKRVQDDADYGVLTVTGVLQKSSNVGVTKMTLSLPSGNLWQLLHNVGFGRRTDTGLPGESAGVLARHRVWNPFVLATLSFGYGIAVTNLQLAHAYSLLAAGGIKKPVSLLKVTTVPKGKRVIDQQTAHELVLMLQSVVEQGGTATAARVPGYHVSGKTGTVRMVGPHGYEKHHHVAVFVGMAPASHPKLVVSVVIKDPKGKFYGGLVSAPVFRKVMGGALRILGIAPDNILKKVSG